MTTTKIRKDFWAVRSGDRTAAVRLVNRMWKVEAIDPSPSPVVTFTSREVAMTAAATMVSA